MAQGLVEAPAPAPPSLPRYALLGPTCYSNLAIFRGEGEGRSRKEKIDGTSPPLHVARVDWMDG